MVRKREKRVTDKRKLLAIAWERLLKKHGLTLADTRPDRSDRKPGERHSFKPMTSYSLPYRRDDVYHNVQSTPITIPEPKKRPEYEGEMALREQRAQEEIARKRKQVAPICNKGAYQYITNPDDWKTVGRKV